MDILEASLKGQLPSPKFQELNNNTGKKKSVFFGDLVLPVTFKALKQTDTAFFCFHFIIIISIILCL